MIYFDGDCAAVLNAVRRAERDDPALAKNPAWWAIRQAARDRFKASLRSERAL